MDIFGAVSVAAVVAGGLLAAFSARRPSRLASWASAYLVLVVGAVQFGLVVGWKSLGSPDAELALAALSLYNLGNIGVLLGTVLKFRLTHYPVMVNFGGGLLALAMVLLVWVVRNAGTSWTFAWLLALVLAILIGMPTGLIMSARRKKHG
jgi:asparagine N-glycosylation enzyme membrane subunit Stt3